MSSRRQRKARRAAAAKAPELVVETTSNVSKASDRGFNPDYSYVIKDLKRIGLLAGTFFAVLIILSFIL